MAKENVTKAVAGVSFLIILCVIYALTISSVLNDSIFTNIDVDGTIADESIVGITNVTNSTLGIKSTYDATCALTSLNNATDGEIILASNYTFYTTDCNIILVDGSGYIGETVNATYTFTYTSNSTLSGLNITDLKSNFGLFIMAVLSFIVIGGTIIGIMWFFKYVKPLLSKKDGLGGMSA